MALNSAPTSLPVVKISRRGARRLQDGHVWVYRSDIVSANGVAPGAAVGVTDERGKFLGTALYSSASQIAIRMISPHAVNDLAGPVARADPGGNQLSRTCGPRHRCLPRGLQRSRLPPWPDRGPLQRLALTAGPHPGHGRGFSPRGSYFRAQGAAETSLHRRTRRSPDPRAGTASLPILGLNSG